MSYSVIIPSKNIDNLTACVKAIREAGDTARVIAVDDGCGEWGFMPAIGVTWIQGAKPFVFARNVNLGIRAASPDDVVLLNDDALLSPVTDTVAGGLRHLASVACDRRYGIVCATTNVTGYPAQMRRRWYDDLTGAFIDSRPVDFAAFVCVYIPRRIIDAVGLLDERFTAYGGEDVDYCLRVREAGLLVGVTDRCYVDHANLPSTYRQPVCQWCGRRYEEHEVSRAPGAPVPRTPCLLLQSGFLAKRGNSAPGDIAESNRIGREKWGNRWPHK